MDFFFHLRSKSIKWADKNFPFPPLLVSVALVLKSPSITRAASGASSSSLSRRLDTPLSPPSPCGSPHRQLYDRPQTLANEDALSTDGGGSCYTELYPGPQSYVERLRVEENSENCDLLRKEDGNVYFSPVVETVSSFKPSKYLSPLMPKENKPLEVGILRRVKELLAEVDPRTAAEHITKADCTVLFTTSISHLVILPNWCKRHLFTSSVKLFHYLFSAK